MQQTIISDYLIDVYSPERFFRVVDKTVDLAHTIRNEYWFDTIVFTGQSGSAMAYPLSYRTGIPLLSVRKPGNGSHFTRDNMNGFGGLLEGNVSTKSYLIVDDMISTGRTMSRITGDIKKYLPLAKPAAILLYLRGGSGESRWEDIPIYGSRNPDDW